MNGGKKVKPQQTEILLQNHSPGYLHSFNVTLNVSLNVIHSLFIIRKVLGMPWNLPGWGALSEVHVCACELLGFINGEELKWGNVGFFFFFFRQQLLLLQGKVGFLPFFLSKWTYMSRRYWNLSRQLGTWKAWEGMPCSDSFSAAPLRWCYCWYFPVHL